MWFLRVRLLSCSKIVQKMLMPIIKVNSNHHPSNSPGERKSRGCNGWWFTCFNSWIIWLVKVILITQKFDSCFYGTKKYAVFGHVCPCARGARSRSSSMFPPLIEVDNSLTYLKTCSSNGLSNVYIGYRVPFEDVFRQMAPSASELEQSFQRQL